MKAPTPSMASRSTKFMGKPSASQIPSKVCRFDMRGASVKQLKQVMVSRGFFSSKSNFYWTNLKKMT